MAKLKGQGVISANGAKCPEGVKFIQYGNPHGKGAPEDYDDSLAGVDSTISETMGQVRKAHKSRNP